MADLAGLAVLASASLPHLPEDAIAGVLRWADDNGILADARVKTCCACRRPYLPARADQKYCSARCKDGASEVRRRERDPEGFRANGRERLRRWVQAHRAEHNVASRAHRERAKQARQVAPAGVDALREPEHPQAERFRRLAKELEELNRR